MRDGEREEELIHPIPPPPYTHILSVAPSAPRVSDSNVLTTNYRRYPP